MFLTALPFRKSLNRKQSELESQIAETREKLRESQQTVAAIERSMATIEFQMDGTILRANFVFLEALGYSLDEIVGQHHRMFAPPGHAETQVYADLWNRLNRGEFVAGEFHRVAKGGKDIWIRAAYNPVFDEDGKPYKVIKFAMDVSEEKRENASYRSQLKAVQQTQAVIEFELDGTILDCNEHFLAALGYRREEIVGRHHRMFVKPDYAESEDYREFWEQLGSGTYQAGQYCRLRKDGQEIWIEASYNPIFDPVGNLVKVVKFASDITVEVRSRKEAAIAAESLSSNVSQMVMTVSEISNNVNQANSLGEQTQSEMKYTSSVIDRLSESSHEIGQVVSLINKFAEQTSLLALNATIEAARAGEAGKGFSVVASEVKSLAQETTSATDRIADSIQQIQTQIAEVIKASEGVDQSVSKVTENISGVAAAIEEQTATLKDINRTSEQLSQISSGRSVAH